MISLVVSFDINETVAPVFLSISDVFELA